MVICNFWASVVTDNENWLLVFKINGRRRFLILGTKGKVAPPCCTVSKRCVISLPSQVLLFFKKKESVAKS